MKNVILEKLCCPFDKQDLQLTPFTTQGDDVKEGLLVCNSCRRYYPIISGIPIMSPDEYRATEFEHPFLEKWQHQLPFPIEGFRTLDAPAAKSLNPLSD